jgi:hypothetical protein
MKRSDRDAGQRAIAAWALAVAQFVRGAENRDAAHR